MAYAIAKRCGNAVTRNTLRRRLRVAASAAGPDLPRGYYLVRAEPAATALPAAQIADDLTRALGRAAGVR